MLPAHLDRDFLRGTRSAELPYCAQDRVEVIRGPYAGRLGEVVSLDRTEDQPRFLVDFEDGTDELISWADLRLFDEATAQSRRHSAMVHWSSAQQHLGLPDIIHSIDPAWILPASSPDDEGWSLECIFDDPPRDVGTPTRAIVRFVHDEAPHDRLVPGAQLLLFERQTRTHARIELLS